MACVAEHRLWVGLALLLCVPAVWGQEPPISEELREAVERGMTEVLEAKLQPPRGLNEERLLARAYAVRGRLASERSARDAAYSRAAAHYETALTLLEGVARAGLLSDRVRLAELRIECGGVVLSGWAAPLVDELVITLGQRVNRERLTTLLERAADQYTRAAATLDPLMRGVERREEELLAAGVYDRVHGSYRELTLNWGWCEYYLSMLAEEPSEKRRRLRDAKGKFQTLIEWGRLGTSRGLCYMALAMAQRDLGRLGDAERAFQTALESNPGLMVDAQTRCEWALCNMHGERHADARGVLEPLVQKDLRKLRPEDMPLRFYYNFAHLLDAYSYLLQADTLRRAASTDAAHATVRRQAQQVRERGLLRMRRLAQLGAPWHDLTRLYVGSAVALDAPPAELSATELLYSAGVLAADGDHAGALKRLEIALARETQDKELIGALLFELGRCQFLMEEKVAAAQTFRELATRYRNHVDAPRAATLAFQLWGEIAEQRRRAEDYERLAASLRNLLENYADHSERERAEWLLPVALELAGQHEAAARQFGKVSRSSPRWEEAQYRQVVCERRVLESLRNSLSSDAYREEALRVVGRLLKYALATERRQATEAGAAGSWAVRARIAAAELLMNAEIDDAVGALDALRQVDPGALSVELVGPLLAARIRTHQRLGQYESAAELLSAFVGNAEPEQAGAILTDLTRDMRAAVDRHVATGNVRAAARLAAATVDVLTAFEEWLRRHSRGQAELRAVRLGRADMLRLAGRLDEASALVDELLAEQPESGDLRLMRARVVTARLGDGVTAEQIGQAREAWALLLSETNLRKRAPERYWEARYNWLSLRLREGAAGDVVQAITQERVWHPEMGGVDWKPKFVALLAEAQRKMEQ